MNSLCPSGSVIARNFQFQVQLNLIVQHKTKFSCTRVSTELLLIGYAGKIRLITETCILLTVYLILLIPRRFADRVSQTSADSTAMRSGNQKFLHAMTYIPYIRPPFLIFFTHFSWNKLQYQME